jgi:hypothetical protein
VSASGDYLDSAVLDRAVDALLSRAGIVALALTDAAVRVRLPDDPRFRRVTGLPRERETVVDFVIPEDRMAVVDVWERAQVIGLAQGEVRLSSRPDQAVTFTIVDAKRRYGVWLGFLNGEDQWEPAADAPPLDVSLLVPTRPRTATIHKNMYGMITHVDERWNGCSAGRPPTCSDTDRWTSSTPMTTSGRSANGWRCGPATTPRAFACDTVPGRQLAVGSRWRTPTSVSPNPTGCSPCAS